MSANKAEVMLTSLEGLEMPTCISVNHKSPCVWAGALLEQHFRRQQ